MFITSDRKLELFFGGLAKSCNQKKRLEKQNKFVEFIEKLSFKNLSLLTKRKVEVIYKIPLFFVVNNC